MRRGRPKDPRFYMSARGFAGWREGLPWLTVGSEFGCAMRGFFDRAKPNGCILEEREPCAAVPTYRGPGQTRTWATGHPLLRERAGVRGRRPLDWPRCDPKAGMRPTVLGVWSTDLNRHHLSSGHKIQPAIRNRAR